MRFLQAFLILSSALFFPANGQPADTAYVFHVEKVANHPPVQLPSGTIPDTCYKKPDSLKSYTVRFSSGKDTVFIGNGTWTGIKSSTTAGTINYNLKAFAGGRFKVWYDTVPYQAELTIFGSGVPVIFSERGPLISSSVKISLPFHPLQKGFDSKGEPKMIISVNGRVIKTSPRKPLISKKCRKHLLYF